MVFAADTDSDDDMLGLNRALNYYNVVPGISMKEFLLQ